MSSNSATVAADTVHTADTPRATGLADHAGAAGSAAPQPVLGFYEAAKTYPPQRTPLRQLWGHLRGSRTTEVGGYTALQPASFEILPGQSIGIVGLNGAGKSTLLQLAAGTLTPSSGQVRSRGRIAALLELGCGFNPEATGLENIFLYAATMGLGRTQVSERVDAICAFSGLSSAHLAMPVKTYSSGMQVRLAFSVATCVDPDILIVDEALSVGDEAFQRKCFARIDAIRDSGATVLFVSHSASTVVELCDRAILLDRGEVLSSGTPRRVISQYQKLLYAPADKVAQVRADIFEGREPQRGQPHDGAVTAVGDGEAGAAADDLPRAYWEEGLRSESAIPYAQQGVGILDPHMQTLDGRRVNHLVPGEQYVYTYKVRFDQLSTAVRFGMMIRTITGVEVGGSASHPEGEGLSFADPEQTAIVRFRFRCRLAPGTYFANAGVLGLGAEGEEYLARIIDVFMFRVMPVPRRLATGLVDLDVVPHVRFA